MATTTPPEPQTPPRRTATGPTTHAHRAAAPDAHTPTRGELGPEPPRGPRRGFTLLELVVVISLLALLTAIAVPTYQNLIDSGELATNRSSNEAIARAVAVALRAERTAEPAATLHSEANPLMNGPTYTVTPDTGPQSSSTNRSELNYAADSAQLAWAAHHNDTTAIMCRVGAGTGAYTCWTHTGPADTHDGDTALAGPPD